MPFSLDAVATVVTFAIGAALGAILNRRMIAHQRAIDAAADAVTAFHAAIDAFRSQDDPRLVRATADFYAAGMVWAALDPRFDPDPYDAKLRLALRPSSPKEAGFDLNRAWIDDDERRQAHAHWKQTLREGSRAFDTGSTAI